MRSTAAMAALLGLGLALGVPGAPAVAEEAQPAGAETRTPWEELEVIPLREAGHKRLVTARGVDPVGYSRVQLRLRNETQTRLAIDIAGASLEPDRRGSCQRLGLGPPVTTGQTVTRGPGTVVVHLEPGEKQVLQVNTVCLDSGRAVPRGQRFALAKKPLPAVREKVLRWWAEHPGAPQGCVNSAIWRNRSQVRLPSGLTARGARTRPVAHRAALLGGVYYQLKGGELTSLDGDGVRRFLGTEILDVFPTGQAVYAVALGDANQHALWRLAMTGKDPWARVTDLDRNAGLTDVIPVQAGLLLVSKKGVQRFDARTKKTELLMDAAAAEAVTVRKRSDGRLTLTLGVPYEKGVERGGLRTGEKAPYQMIWSLDAAARKKTLVRRAWNVSQASAGHAGVFALSHKGRLRKLQRKTFKEFGPGNGYRHIVAVGKTTLWLVDRNRNLVALSPKTGKRRHRTRIQTASPGFRHDPVTDDLAYVTGGKFHRIAADDGTQTEVPQTTTPDPR